jgi:hypothetical protein
MNGIVNELIALVGGAGEGSSSGHRSRQGKRLSLSSADHVFHRIAKGSSEAALRTPARQTAGEKVIPLSDDDEFDRFNA